MARTSRGVQAHARHKKILKLAKGYVGASSRSFRSAKQAVIKAAQYAYRDRRTRRRDFRALWIMRINAAARLHALTYSQLIAGMKEAQCVVNRKMLADLAYQDGGQHPGFVQLVQRVKSCMAA